MDITHDLNIKAQSETIYKAVATQKGIQSWWCNNSEVAETEGGTSLLKFNKEGTIVPMSFKTITLNPNKKVVWECIENPNPAWIGTQITTTIEDEGKVTFTHSGFDDKWKGQEAFEMTKGTWNHFMSSLKASIANAVEKLPSHADFIQQYCKS